MTTTVRDARATTAGRENSKPWKMATAAFALSTAVLGFMYFSERNEGHDMNMQTSTAHGAHYDHAFMNMMIPHHQRAIDDSREALKEAQHPELKQLARNIIQSQQAEIDQMKQWRKSWYGE